MNWSLRTEIDDRLPPTPVNSSCTAVSGAITTSSWSWKPVEPFEASTPRTMKFSPLNCTVWPTAADALPNKSSATVVPMTATSDRLV